MKRWQSLPGGGARGATQARLRCVVGGFSPSRGTEKLDGGFRLLQNGTENFKSENEVSDLVASGILLAGRFFPSGDAGTRSIVLNYRFRKPLA